MYSPAGGKKEKIAINEGAQTVPVRLQQVGIQYLATWGRAQMEYLRGHPVS
jgi:hypothetical protein